MTSEAGKGWEGLGAHSAWLDALRRYLHFVAAANLVWEIAQLPLYSIWANGDARELVVAVVHCTGGDVLIASTALLVALLVAGNRRWPANGYWRVAALATALGLGYTLFSEQLNLVTGKWAYSERMPMVPVVGVGLSPLAQWIAIPGLGFWFAWRVTPVRGAETKEDTMKIRPWYVILVVALGAGVGAAIWFSGDRGEAAKPLSQLLQDTHVHGVAVDPKDPSKINLATHHGFYVISPDGMATRLSSNTDDFMGFTPHPSDASTLYASGHPAGGGNLGVIMSSDGGRSWRQIAKGVNGPVDFHAMDVSKADPKTIYGVYDGLQVSRDGGRTWEPIAQPPEGLIDLAASSKDVNTLYAATQNGLLVSKDVGKSWQAAALPKQPASMVHTTAAGDLYVFLFGTGLVHTTEPDLNWTTLSNPFGDGYVFHLAVDPSDRNNLYAFVHKMGVQASRDGGRTWSALESK